MNAHYRTELRGEATPRREVTAFLKRGFFRTELAKRQMPIPFQIDANSP
jgi:hypothetical protein